MSRLSIPAVNDAPAAARPLLDAVQKQLGVTPNLMKLLAHSPAALEGYLSLNGALGKGALDARLRESIALAVAEYNGCDYCLAAHSYLGKNVARMSDDAIVQARDGHSTDPRHDAALRFAHAVANERGRVSDAALAAVRAAGFSEGEVLEIVAAVAVNVLTNYVNNVARTDVDFPRVSQHTPA